MNTLTQTAPGVNTRQNIWKLTTGHVIGFGPLASPNGKYFCFNCKVTDCGHIAKADKEWLEGKYSVLSGYQVPASSGYHAAAVSAPPISQTFVTPADISAVERGNKSGAWRARGIEQMPSGWTRTVLR